MEIPGGNSWGAAFGKPIGQQNGEANGLGEVSEVGRGPGSGQGPGGPVAGAGRVVEKEGPGRLGSAVYPPGLARCPLQRPLAAPWNSRAAAASAPRGAGAATARRTLPPHPHPQPQWTLAPCGWGGCQLESDLGLGQQFPLFFFMKLFENSCPSFRPGPRERRKGLCLCLHLGKK